LEEVEIKLKKYSDDYWKAEEDLNRLLLETGIIVQKNRGESQ
jgi:hypothetical protein